MIIIIVLLLLLIIKTIIIILMIHVVAIITTTTFRLGCIDADSISGSPKLSPVLILVAAEIKTTNYMYIFSRPISSCSKSAFNFVSVSHAKSAAEVKSVSSAEPFLTES